MKIRVQRSANHTTGAFPRRYCLAVALMLFAVPVIAQEASVDQLVTRLASRDVAVRRTAAGKLSELGVEAQPAVPALAKALADDDRAVRFFAAEALESALPDDRELVTQVLDAVERVHRTTGRKRREAVGELGQPGLAGEIALPLLVKLLDEPQTRLSDRYAVMSAITRLEKTAQPAEVPLRSLLAEKDLTVAGQAGVALSYWQAEPQQVIEVLRRSITHDAYYVPAEEVVAALERYRQHQAAVDALTDCLYHDSSLISFNAALALSRLEAKPDAVIPVLEQGLSGDRDTFRHAATGLARYGARAGKSAEIIAKRIDREPELFNAAYEALFKINPGRARTFHEYVRLHRPRDVPDALPPPMSPDLRNLWKPPYRKDDSNEFLLPALLEVADEMESQERKIRTRGIQRAEELAKLHGWTLIDTLCDMVARGVKPEVRQVGLRGWEALALGKRRTARRMAVFAFEQALRDDDVTIRHMACQAAASVFQVNPNNKALRSILVAAMNDPDTEIRQLARNAVSPRGILDRYLPWRWGK